MGDFVSYFWDQTNCSGCMRIIIRENWTGSPLLVLRDVATGAVVHMPFQDPALQFTQANCAGPAYVETTSPRTWPIAYNGWNVVSGPVQTINVLSERTGGGCSNLPSFPDDVYPITSIAVPPTYSSPLRPELN